MKKKVALLLVLALCLCGCSDKVPAETAAAGNDTVTVNLWSAEKSVDEFGAVIADSKASVQCPISGEFSNTATTGGELKGAVYMRMLDDTPIFFIRLLEYGDQAAFYTGYDPLEFKIKVDDSITEFSSVVGNPPNNPVMVYDTAEALYTALYNGKDVRCIVQIGSSKYQFTLSGSNFAQICKDNGYITQELYFSTQDEATLYNKAKELYAVGNYYEAIQHLERLGNYEDSKELLLEVACNAYYYAQSGDTYKVCNNAWEQFFDEKTAVPLTEEELREIMPGQWQQRDGDSYSTYTEDGQIIYTGGTNDGDTNAWFVENGRLVIDYRHFTAERTIYPFYQNVYVFRTHQSSSDVYELYFHNGPLE